MEKIFEIAASIKTPLALGGLVAIIFFFIVKKIINKVEIPKSIQVRAGILKKIINFSYVLAILAVILGFLGYIAAYTDFHLNIIRQVKIDPIEVKPIHITIDVNVKIDKALDDFFSEIDEAGANSDIESAVKEQKRGQK
nr:hypothetical protein [Desulfogranum marinum]